MLPFVCWVACRNKTEETVDLGYNYFPVNTGHELLYDVDSIVYDDNTGNTTIDTFNYQYREVITADVTDGAGRPSQLVERYFRDSDTGEWRRGNTWLLSRDAGSAQKVQENVRFVKLLFPLNDHKYWDGNAYNNRGSEQYTIEYFDQPSTVNGQNYERTLKVLQMEEVNAIEEIRRYEIYARDIGLICFQSDSINTQPKPQGGSKSRGLRYTLRLRSYR